MFEFFSVKEIDSYLSKYKKVIIIHDQNIKKYYSDLLDQLPYYKFVIEPGESSKNLRTKTEIEQMCIVPYNKNMLRFIDYTDEISTTKIIERIVNRFI